MQFKNSVFVIFFVLFEVVAYRFNINFSLTLDFRLILSLSPHSSNCIASKTVLKLGQVVLTSSLKALFHSSLKL